MNTLSDFYFYISEYQPKTHVYLSRGNCGMLHGGKSRHEKPDVQVSDTTGDAMKYCCWLPKCLFIQPSGCLHFS